MFDSHPDLPVHHSCGLGGCTWGYRGSRLGIDPVSREYENRELPIPPVQKKKKKKKKKNLNFQRCASTNHNTTTHNHHQDQYVLLIIYQYKYATSSINHVSTILLTSASNYVQSMYQSCINYDSSICTNIINYTPHVCANSSTICLNHLPNIYLNQKPSSFSSSKSDL
jgi:hypothetical protein